MQQPVKKYEMPKVEEFTPLEQVKEEAKVDNTAVNKGAPARKKKGGAKAMELRAGFF